MAAFDERDAIEQHPMSVPMSLSIEASSDEQTGSISDAVPATCIWPCRFRHVLA